MPRLEDKVIEDLSLYEKYFAEQKKDGVNCSAGLAKLQHYLEKFLMEMTQPKQVRPTLSSLKGKIEALKGVDEIQIVKVISLITPYLDAPKGGSIPPSSDVPKSNSESPNNISVPKDNLFDFVFFEAVMDYSDPVGMINFTKNTGNNCSLISLIQVIFHTPELRQTLLLKPSKYQNALQNLASQYAKKAQGENIQLNVDELRLLFAENGIPAKSQQDPNDFLGKMIGEINSDNLTNIWTEIVEYDLEKELLFEEQSPILLNDVNENKRSVSLFFHNLMITNEQNLSLSKLFENFKNPPKPQNSKLEQVESNLICKKDGTVMQAAVKTRHYEIKKLTDLLVFSLMRIDAHGKKITQRIDIDKEFTTGHKLRSFITHIGSSSSGHYVSCIKQGDKWFHCDDNSVKKRTEKEALLKAKDAYLFFYHRDPSS